MRTAFSLSLCGLALSLAAVERRYGVPQKPYWEGEWHTVLYNYSRCFDRGWVSKNSAPLPIKTPNILLGKTHFLSGGD